jgi:hypothetical protein
MFDLAVAAMDLSRADRYRPSRLATARSCTGTHLRRSIPGTEEPNRPVSGPQWITVPVAAGGVLRGPNCSVFSALNPDECGVRHPCQATIPIVTG